MVATQNHNAPEDVPVWDRPPDAASVVLRFKVSGATRFPLCLIPRHLRREGRGRDREGAAVLRFGMFPGYHLLVRVSDGEL